MVHIRRIKENGAKKHSTRLVISQSMKLLSEVAITKRCTLSRRLLTTAGYFKHCKSLQDSFVDKETLQTPMTPTAMPSLRTTDRIELDFDNGSLHPSSSLACLFVPQPNSRNGRVVGSPFLSFSVFQKPAFVLSSPVSLNSRCCSDHRCLSLFFCLHPPYQKFFGFGDSGRQS